VQMLARGARFSISRRWDRALGWIEGAADTSS
jgi:hypothetical protein